LPIAPGLTPHGLRHTHKTLMREVGTAPKLMDERMGHEDGSVQSRYDHITAGMRQALAAALSVLPVVLAGGCEGTLLYFRAVRCAALAARVAAVRIGSSWTNVFDGSAVNDAARWWTATQTTTRTVSLGIGPVCAAKLCDLRRSVAVSDRGGPSPTLASCG